jgi:hypothetical protein
MDGAGKIERANTDLRFTWLSSAESAPFSFLFRGCGLETSEHSPPLNWQGMQPSSSSPLMVHWVRVRRHSRQGTEGLYVSEAALWRQASRCEAAEENESWRQAAGLGAMAMGAVLATVVGLDMTG